MVGDGDSVVQKMGCINMDISLALALAEAILSVVHLAVLIAERM
jgi:hypothetical protein